MEPTQRAKRGVDVGGKIVDILASETVKTRKPHMCNGCRKTYDAGVNMLRQSIADCGTVYRVYCCNVCQEVMIRTMEPGDEYSDGDLYDGDREYWEDVKAELEENEIDKE